MFRLICLVSVCVSLLAGPAFGFTPDDEELTARLHKAYGGLTSWEAEMTFPDHPGVSVHLWYAKGKWRQEWSGGAKAVGMNGSVVASCVEGSFSSSPLFVWMPNQPVETWKSWGIDSSINSFGFFDGYPSYLYGAEPGDETTPMVQLNNEDGSPLMVRYNTDNGLTTIQYGGYRTLGGFQVPQEVLVMIGGDIAIRAKVEWIAVDRAEGEELYARDALDATVCPAPASPFDLLRDSFQYPSAQ